MPSDNNDFTGTAVDESAVAVVRRIYEALGGSGVDPFVLLHPDIEWVTPAALPWTVPGSDGRYVGHAALREYFTHCLHHVQALRVEVDDIVPAGERVLMVGRECGTARATGKEFVARCAHLWTVAGAQAVRLDGFPDTAAMRDAFT